MAEPKPKVYIESSVVSYYTAHNPRDLVAAAHRQITIEWWEGHLDRFEPVISELVLEEIRRGNEMASARRTKSVESFHLLPVDEETEALAVEYLKALRFDEAALADAVHVAVASLNQIEYLVSWNCRHIANARVMNAIRAVNERENRRTPLLCTPEVLFDV